jgi:hypothetical protein
MFRAMSCQYATHSDDPDDTKPEERERHHGQLHVGNDNPPAVFSMAWALHLRRSRRSHRDMPGLNASLQRNSPATFDKQHSEGTLEPNGSIGIVRSKRIAMQPLR